jgi:hypothetical protein
MMGDEAPAATTGGVNERECDRAEIGSDRDDRFNSQEAVRPASLLRKSILDVDRRASTATGRTATFKLRAIPIRK